MAGHAAKFADRLLANAQQATPILPKNTRTLTRDAQIQTFPIPFRPFLLGIPRIHSTRSLRFFGAAVRSTSSSLCLHYACKRSHPFGEDSGFVSHSEKQRSGQYCGLQGLLWNIGMCFFFSLPCRLLQCLEIELLAIVGGKCGCQPFAAHIR